MRQQYAIRFTAALRGQAVLRNIKVNVIDLFSRFKAEEKQFHPFKSSHL